MARSAASRTAPVRADINVTPMIDVMLVLLIIFMLVTPVISSGPVSLPRAANAARDEESPREVRLGVDVAGRFYLDVTGADGSYTGPRYVTDGDLPGRLAGLYTNRTADRILYLKADQNVDFARVQQAIEMARHAGVRVVAAIVEQERAARVRGEG